MRRRDSNVPPQEICVRDFLNHNWKPKSAVIDEKGTTGTLYPVTSPKSVEKYGYHIDYATFLIGARLYGKFLVTFPKVKHSNNAAANIMLWAEQGMDKLQTEAHVKVTLRNIFLHMPAATFCRLRVTERIPDNRSESFYPFKLCG